MVALFRLAATVFLGSANVANPRAARRCRCLGPVNPTSFNSRFYWYSTVLTSYVATHFASWSSPRSCNRMCCSDKYSGAGLHCKLCLYSHALHGNDVLHLQSPMTNKKGWRPYRPGYRWPETASHDDWAIPRRECLTTLAQLDRHTRFGSRCRQYVAAKSADERPSSTHDRTLTA